MNQKSRSLDKINDFSNLKGFELINKLKSKEIKIDDVIKKFTQRIKLYNKELNVFKFFDEKNIEDQLKQITKNSPLMGIPVAIKDIFNTKTMNNSMGTKIYENYLAGNDARVVEDIRRKGGVIMGKSYASEFAVHNPSLTVNPWNSKLSPGTSSGGSAVAVASKMVPISVATQTAGSIIRPASYCGVFGFKPSFGVIARTGVLKTADTLDTIGFFANCVEDLKIIFDLTRQMGRNYPIIQKYMDNNDYKDVEDKEITIGIIKGPRSKNIDKKLSVKFKNLISKIKKKNFTIEEFLLPKIFNKAHLHHDIIYSKSLSYYLKNEFKNHENQFSESLTHIMIKGKKINLDEYKNSIRYQLKIQKNFDRIFKKFDFLIDLSTFGSAPNFNSNGSEDHNLIWTMGHLPSISLPLIMSDDNLPVGLQINTKKYGDYRLLKFASYLTKKINDN